MAVGVQLRFPPSLALREDPVPARREAVLALGRSYCGGKEKCSNPYRESSSGRPVGGLVTMRDEIYWLLRLIYLSETGIGTSAQKWFG
jgi:hypothetical protein